MEAVLEDAYVLIHQGKISARPGPAAGAGEGRPDRQAAAHRRRGRRRRGPLDARRQQDPRHVQRRRGQGAGLRRPPQGDAAGPRHPHRRPGHRARRSASSSTRSASTVLGQARRVVVTKDDTTIIDGGGDGDEVTGRVAPDQGRDRAHRLRLGPREAPGAPREARRRRLRHQGRRAHRGGAQGEEAPHRGRHLGDPRGHRGGHRRRWRLGSHPRRVGHRRPRPRPATRRTGALDRPQGRSHEPLRWIAENAGAQGYVVTAKVAELQRRPRVSTPPRASTATWSRPASSTRSR